MFQKAAKLKLRFDSSKGQLTVEDLYDLPLTSTTGRPNLDSIAQELDKQLKTSNPVSFVNPSKKTNEITQLKFDLVKHIIDEKMAENTANLQARDKAVRKQRILEAIAEQQDKELKGKSLDELLAMVNELE